MGKNRDTLISKILLSFVLVLLLFVLMISFSFGHSDASVAGNWITVLIFLVTIIVAVLPIYLYERQNKLESESLERFSKLKKEAFRTENRIKKIESDFLYENCLFCALISAIFIEQSPAFNLSDQQNKQAFVKSICKIACKSFQLSFQLEKSDCEVRIKNIYGQLLVLKKGLKIEGTLRDYLMDRVDGASVDTYIPLPTKRQIKSKRLERGAHSTCMKIFDILGRTPE